MTSVLTAKGSLFAPPAPPSGLAATPSGPTQVLLAWKDNSGDEDSFQVWRRLSSDTTFVKVGGDLPANATSLTDNTVSASTAYVYKVRAKNAEGPSAFSETVAVTTFDLPPAAPTNLTAVRAEGSENEVELSWTDNATNETGYQVARIPAVINGSWETVANLAANRAGYRDVSSVAGTGYTYKVYATNNGNGVAGNMASIVLPPAKPTGSAASAVSDGEVRLVWNDVAGETGYDVRYKKTDDSTWTTVAAPENATEHTASGLVPGTSYDLAVRAKNAGGPSVYTGIKSAATMALLAPASLTATALSSTKIRLQWTDNSKAESGYKIERKTAGGAYAEVGTVGANAASYDDAGLAASTAYTYRARASHASGDSGYGDEAGGTTLAPPYLKEVVVADDCLIGGGTTTATVRLSGPAPTNQTVTLSRSSSLVTIPSTVVVPADSSEATFTVTVANTIEPSSASLYASDGNWMQKAKVSNLPSLASTLPNLTATPIQGGVSLSWTSFTEDVYGRTLSGYHVSRSSDGANYARLTTKPLTASGFVDTTAQPSATYWYQVELTDETGSLSAQSATVSVTHTGTASQISWISPPVLPVSGTITLSATRPTGDQQAYQLVVDGMPYAISQIPSGNTVFGSTIDITLDTMRLANGTHMFHLVSGEENPRSSAAISLTISNPISKLSNDGIAEIGSSDFPRLAASLSNPIAYTIEIRDGSGTVVRSWSGEGERAQVVWDGRNNTGSLVADGQYTAQVITNGYLTYPEYLYKVGVAPEFLSICTIFTSNGFWTQECSRTYAANVGSSIAGRSNNGIDYSHFTLTVDEGQSISLQFAKQIRKWLRSTVKYLYIYAHGRVPKDGTDPNHFALIGSNLYIADYGRPSWAKNPPMWIDVWAERGYRPYKFAWIDTCGGLGGDSDATGNDTDEWYSRMTKTPNTRWINALGINTSPGYYEGFFMAYNGWGYMNEYGLVSSGAGQAFRAWKEYWWTAFRNGNTAADCTIYAMGHLSFTATEPNPNSWSSRISKPKMSYYGDWQW